MAVFAWGVHMCQGCSCRCRKTVLAWGVYMCQGGKMQLQCLHHGDIRQHAPSTGALPFGGWTLDLFSPASLPLARLTCRQSTQDPGFKHALAGTLSPSAATAHSLSPCSRRAGWCSYGGSRAQAGRRAGMRCGLRRVRSTDRSEGRKWLISDRICDGFLLWPCQSLHTSSAPGCAPPFNPPAHPLRARSHPPPRLLCRANHGGGDPAVQPPDLGPQHGAARTGSGPAGRVGG